MHALGLEFGSAAQLSKRPGSVWNCLWGNALKRSPGIIRKSRVSYPVPGFLSSATWPPLPKQHYNGLNQIKPNHMNGVPTCISGQLISMTLSIYMIPGQFVNKPQNFSYHRYLFIQLFIFYTNIYSWVYTIQPHNISLQTFFKTISEKGTSVK